MVAESPEPRRGYASPIRTERARRTRAHVIATAERLFAEHGYAGTSVRRIAAEAGVGLETVTQTGRKANLLLSAFLARLSGGGDAVDLSALLGEEPAPDTADAVRQGVERIADALRGSLGIWRAFTVAASSDETVAAVRTDLADARRRDITAWLETQERAGVLPVRSDTARARLADALGLLVSHEAYEHLTLVCGWPHEEYVAWTASAVLAQLTAPNPAD